ncbi:MAG: hypothetical protein JXA22_05475 [Candidatus Thermoplasmatota archaeon]|nr:hypothetical protein [Candidatus Thermoplasmatota archaeon]
MRKEDATKEDHEIRSINMDNNILMRVLFTLSTMTATILIFIDSRHVAGVHVLISLLFILTMFLHTARHYRWITTVLKSSLGMTVQKCEGIVHSHDHT